MLRMLSSAAVLRIINSKSGEAAASTKAGTPLAASKGNSATEITRSGCCARPVSGWHTLRDTAAQRSTHRGDMANAVEHEVIVLDDDSSSPEPELKRESPVRVENSGSPPQKRARVEPAAGVNRQQLMGSDPPPPMDFFEVSHLRLLMHIVPPNLINCSECFAPTPLSPYPAHSPQCTYGAQSARTFPGRLASKPAPERLWCLQPTLHVGL